MLKRLYVDNFRCMVNFECRFGAKQLILGPNGSGKTTLFDVVMRIRDVCGWGMPIDRLFLGSTKTRWQSVAEQTFELDVARNDTVYTFRLIVDTGGSPERPRIVTEEVRYAGEPLFRFTKGEVQLFDDGHKEKSRYPFDPHLSALATVPEQNDNAKLSWFKRWLGNLLFINADPRQMRSISQTEDRAPTVDLSNFSAWYRHLRLENDDHELLADLRDVLPGLNSIALKDMGMGNRFLAFAFSMHEEGRAALRQDQILFGIEELSDGQRILVALYTILHFAAKRGATLFLDEPDNYLALSEIQPWLDRLLENVDDEDCQVFIASHHPELLNRLAVQSGLLLEGSAGRPTRARPYADPAETGLAPAEVVARGWDHE